MRCDTDWDAVLPEIELSEFDDTPCCRLSLRRSLACSLLRLVSRRHTSMNIGVVKEIKDKENRVALTPHGAHTLVQAGHTVRVESGAGLGSGFSDADYAATGAALVTTADAWNTDLVLKVKEPLPAEYGFLSHQMLFTYFHLAGVSPDLTAAL